MKKKHILIVSQYFFPEQFRVNDLCKEWISRGYEVTVLTGKPNYPEGKFYSGYNFWNRRKETYEGATIIRLPLIPRGNNSIMLALNYLSFVFFGFFWALFSKSDVDSVFVYEVSPMTQALPGVWYAKRKKIPCYIYVLDLWPENFEIITGISNQFIIKQLTRMVKYIYKNCKKIFISSNKFADSINDKGDFEDKIIFWPQYAEDFYSKSVLDGMDIVKSKEFRKITFAGNVGYAQGLEILPEVAVKLRDLSVYCKFEIIGDGRYKANLMKEVEEKSVMDYFDFIEKQPATAVPKYLADTDMSLISLAKNEIFKMTIPAKLQSTMACGVPVLVVADGEVNRIVSESKCGLTGASGDIEKLVSNVIQLSKLDQQELEIMGKNSLHYYQTNFDKEELLNQMDNYLEE
ncbi:glycosyltransferase family 4 protein [Vagococcus sp. BWB3-3]|uniref:Glycosyltransferase family 4 protein n=1 Tax=Vagococcus allomyrinae TaxID=2794353 RepID=A0A940SWU8_9ENTE|nr:glycosyltransferase family 4 protein [Vagococcus allomyrinae]MBP1043650.1 glycosyltransferase family 4 protein [Vagococcus allomyrinae]